MIAILFILLLYALLIGWLLSGWMKLRSGCPLSDKPLTTISLLIPARNEQENISLLLEDIQHQDYPMDLLEIIVIDDHSEDQTAILADSFIPEMKYKMRVIRVTGATSGKKNALHMGVSAAMGELIITTDADCRAGPAWIRSIASCYEQVHPQMILGPVRYSKSNTLCGWLQELEFMSLQFTTAGSAGMENPLLANGANLTFNRKAYDACGGYRENSSFASGDDMFLLSGIKRKFGKTSIYYLKSAKAIVTTDPESTLKGFVSQRLRWVSKTRGYNDWFLLSVSALVYLINLVIFISLIAGMFSYMARWIALVLLAFKMLIDLPSIITTTRFFQRMQLIWLLPVLELVNSIYTSCIGLAGNLVAFRWKGRRFNPGIRK